MVRSKEYIPQYVIKSVIACPDELVINELLDNHFIKPASHLNVLGMEVVGKQIDNVKYILWFLNPNQKFGFTNSYYYQGGVVGLILKDTSITNEEYINKIVKYEKDLKEHLVEPVTLGYYLREELEMSDSKEDLIKLVLNGLNDSIIDYLKENKSEILEISRRRRERKPRRKTIETSIEELSTEVLEEESDIITPNGVISTSEEGCNAALYFEDMSFKQVSVLLSDLFIKVKGFDVRIKSDNGNFLVKASYKREKEQKGIRGFSDY
jgi:hypothetical protein